MKKFLLFSVLILSIPSVLSAQSWGPGEWEAEHPEMSGLDSVDYPGYIYFHKHGEHPTGEVHNSPMRYQPSEGAPLFVSNAGFESGDFTGWNGIIGDNTVSSTGPLQNIQPGIFAGAINPLVSDMSARHNIMQAPAAGNDNEGNFPIVPSGYGTYTVRLGNTYATYQGQAIQQSWIVSAGDTALVISYAVVMYDGTHPANEGSYFQIEIRDTAQNPIYTRHDESNALPPTYLPGTTSQIDYLPWEQDTFNLSAFAGQTLTIRFTAAGCIWGGHYCYAYVDCDPLNANTIGVTEYNSPEVIVYPNPSADGIYYVSIEAEMWNAQIEVYDMSGRIVPAVSTKNTSGWMVDLSQCEAGIYTARFQNEEGTKYATLIR